MIDVYYCKQTETPTTTHKISPAPQINISPEVYYANDSVIGYTYNITLSGYANALRKELNPGSTNSGADITADHMGKIREIFNTNGGNLYIKEGGDDLLVAKGATIKSIQFNESNNGWSNYSPFTIDIEFNELDLQGCSGNPLIACSGSIFHQDNSYKIISDKLIDITKYKIKEFNDKWTFTIDNQIYETGSVFKVSYLLSATGKNYYVNDNLVPAWQQARLFVQDKLYNQIMSLISGELQIENDNDDACEATKDITQIHDIDNTSVRSGGMMGSFRTLRDGSPNYDIYNETIVCNTSESDGSFSVTYNAILKRYNPSMNPLANAALHKYTKNISTDSNSETSITVQGNIQGLIRGGFIYYNNDFILPQNGTFITAVDSTETKYSNALAYYSTMIGNNSDLFEGVKSTLNIRKSQLLIKGTDGSPSPSSFTLDHNYHEGSIGYNATYSQSLARALGSGYTNISITRQDPTEIIQEFIIPGRRKGPIIQKLNMKTARTVSVNIEGASADNKKCTIEDICANIPYFSIDNFEQLITENEGWVKTREDYTVNALDGSYSISLDYTVL